MSYISSFDFYCTKYLNRSHWSKVGCTTCPRDEDRKILESIWGKFNSCKKGKTFLMCLSPNRLHMLVFQNNFSFVSWIFHAFCCSSNDVVTTFCWRFDTDDMETPAVRFFILLLVARSEFGSFRRFNLRFSSRFLKPIAISRKCAMLHKWNWKLFVPRLA